MDTGTNSLYFTLYLDNDRADEREKIHDWTGVVVWRGQ